MLQTLMLPVLASSTSLEIVQRKELAELFGFESRNKYVIHAGGTPVGYAAEQGKGALDVLARWFLGHYRTFEVHFFDTERRPFLRAVHPFRLFFRRLDVFAGDGRFLGRIQQRFAFLSKRFDVQDANGEVVMSVSSAFFRPWTFVFQRADRELARIEKKWAGTLTEIFTDADRFRVTYPAADLTVDQRQLVLAAAVYVDLQYFEKKASLTLFQSFYERTRARQSARAPRRRRPRGHRRRAAGWAHFCLEIPHRDVCRYPRRVHRRLLRLSLAAPVSLVFACASGDPTTDALNHDNEDTGEIAQATTCPPSVSVYPVQGPHNHGYDKTAGDASKWTCGNTASNSDFVAGDHLGNDIWAAEGTPVVASVSGTFQNVGYTAYSGNKVTIVDSCGWSHFFCHLQKHGPGISSASNGQKVTAGQVIGYVGKTGSESNGVVHLHYSLFPDGVYKSGIDPYPYLKSVEANTCAPANTPPTGFIDSAGCDAGVVGWSQDPNAKDAAIGVQLRYDGAAPGGVPVNNLANLYRGDLCSAIGSCNHGFVVPAPLSLFDNQPHTVHAYGLDSQSGTAALLGNSPKSFTCAAKIPPGIKRWIINPTSFDAWRFNTFQSLLPVSKAAIDAVPDGEQLPATPVLIQATGEPEVYLLDNGRKRHVPSAAVMNAWSFDWGAIQQRSPAQVAAIPTGPKVRARAVLGADSKGRLLVFDDPFASTGTGGAGGSGAGGSSGAGGAGASGAAGKAGSAGGGSMGSSGAGGTGAGGKPSSGGAGGTGAAGATGTGTAGTAGAAGGGGTGMSADAGAGGAGGDDASGGGAAGLGPGNGGAGPTGGSSAGKAGAGAGGVAGAASGAEGTAVRWENADDTSTEGACTVGGTAPRNTRENPPRVLLLAIVGSIGWWRRRRAIRPPTLSSHFSIVPTYRHLLALALAFPVLVVAVGCGEDDPASSTPTGNTAGAGGSGAAAGAAGEAGAGGTTAANTASIEGDVLAFLTEVPGPRVAGAKVSVLEHPEKSVVTGADAHFRFDDLPVGEDVTLVVEHPDFQTTTTATYTMPAGGIHPFSVQIVSTDLFNALSGVMPQPTELDKYCAIATTVARFGGSLYVRLRQGMPGVTAVLSPSVPAESGPIYFNESVIPDAKQPSTSIDGGVLYYRVPPGDYTMTGQKDGIVFNTVRFHCTAGAIVNAGPPLGLLANVPTPNYSAGTDRPDDTYSAATDALCEKTSACVNEAAKADNYPAATIASCKAMFRNTWGMVDTSCDAEAGLREAARALYTCRAASCEVTLGGDEACVPEETAVRAAEVTYGACLGK